MCRLLRKYKLSFSFKAATLHLGAWINASQNSVWDIKPGNSIMVEWSLKYVTSKFVLCFILVNTKDISYLCKKSK